MRSLLPARERDRALVFVAVWAVSLVVLASGISAVAPPSVPTTQPIQAELAVRGPSWTLGRTIVTTNNSAFTLLREANVTLGFELRWVAYGWPYNDVFVTSINGTASDGARNLWWQYCVNGTYATVGAASQQVRDGDVVLWVYAAPEGNGLCR